MDEDIRPPGTTTIAPDVLLTIAYLTALSIEGVSHMSNKQGRVNRLIRRGHQNNGVYIEVQDDTVNADLYLVLNKDVNIRDVSHNVQNDVARAISEMVGMTVGHVNVHIEDIDYGLENQNE